MKGQRRTLLERGDHAWSEDSIRLILTPSTTAKSLYFYVQEIGYFKTHYPYYSERQNLESFLIVYTVSGTGELEYEDTTYTLTQGQCFFINCDEHHVYRTPKGGTWDILWVHFCGNNALGYYKELTRNGFKILDCQDDYFIADTIWNMIPLHEKKDLTTEIVASNMINEVLTRLLVQAATDNADTFLIPDFIREIMREIDRNYQADLSLGYFEELVHRSRYYLAKTFKRYVGTTINEYLITTRISHAKELLKYTDLSVGEIALECGMSNVSHFINMFKARVGQTPLAYRKAWTS